MRSGVQNSLISSGLFVSLLTDTPLLCRTSSQAEVIHAAPQTAVVMAVVKTAQARLRSRFAVIRRSSPSS
ncbi:hypothetical protein [Streptomyces sp. NPDC093591]|uniref:hypothetical protein n=1 Tax=Streptomyces sp. NPDC093591 TaxID=3366044 RepID=UPI003808AC4A